MSNYEENKETASRNFSKDCIANLRDDAEFKEYIVKYLSSELADRIMDILDREEEIIVIQSDLRVSEFMPTNSVEYRRQINWSSLVRCKDCKHNSLNRISSNVYCDLGIGLSQLYDYCSHGERREDEID